MEDKQGTDHPLIAYHRRGLLQLADKLDNVQEACRRAGTTRTSLYFWKKRFEEFGMAGLANRPSTHKSHPMKKTRDEGRRVIETALDHPDWGANRLSAYLTEMGHRIANDTVQDTLARHGMATRASRVERLQLLARDGRRDLTETQIRAVEQMNPLFRERNARGASGGERLVQDTLRIESFPQLGRVYMQVVVDTYSAYAFVLLCPDRKPHWPIEVLHNQALPFFRLRGLKVETVTTDKSPEFVQPHESLYQAFLRRNGVAHVTPPGRRPPTNGCIAYFKQTFTTEFHHDERPHGLCSSLPDLRESVDRWLAFYNTERPICGSPNYQRTPADMLRAPSAGEDPARTAIAAGSERR